MAIVSSGSQRAKVYMSQLPRDLLVPASFSFPIDFLLPPGSHSGLKAIPKLRDDTLG